MIMTIVKRELANNKYVNSENTYAWNLLPLSTNVLEFILKLEVHLFPDVKNDTCFLLDSLVLKQSADI